MRNKIRRRLREIYRLNEERLSVGYDFVVVARSRCVNAEYSRMDSEFLHLAEKLGVLK